MIGENRMVSTKEVLEEILVYLVNRPCAVPNESRDEDELQGGFCDTLDEWIESWWNSGGLADDLSGYLEDLLSLYFIENPVEGKPLDDEVLLSEFSDWAYRAAQSYQPDGGYVAYFHDD